MTTLAKNGSHMKIPNHTEYRIPHSTLIAKIKNHYKQLHLTRWQNTPLSKQTKILVNLLLKTTNNNIQKLSKEIIKLNTNDLRTLVKTITGHNCLNYHLKTIGYASNTDCSYCSPKEEDKINHIEYEQETATHILCECPAFSKIRQEQYGTHKMDIEELIMKNTGETIKHIIKFMNKTGALKRVQKYTKNSFHQEDCKKGKIEIQQKSCIMY